MSEVASKSVAVTTPEIIASPVTCSFDVGIVIPIPTLPVIERSPENVETPETFNCFDINVPSECAVETPARVTLNELSPLIQRQLLQPISN